MDTKALVRKLNRVFCDANQKDRKYAEIWLSEVDFGGMYKSGDFVLHVKAQYQLEYCFKEIKVIFDLLSERAKDELKLIWRLSVYNADEQVQPECGDILVYTLEDVCA